MVDRFFHCCFLISIKSDQTLPVGPFITSFKISTPERKHRRTSKEPIGTRSPRICRYQFKGRKATARCLRKVVPDAEYCNDHLCFVLLDRRRCKNPVDKTAVVPACHIREHQEKLFEATSRPKYTRRRVEEWLDRSPLTASKYYVGSKAIKLFQKGEAREVKSSTTTRSWSQASTRALREAADSPVQSVFSASLQSDSETSTPATPVRSSAKRDDELPEDCHISWRAFSAGDH